MYCGSYANRRAIATPFGACFATLRGLADLGESANYPAMFDRYRFLNEILKKAGSQAEVGRVLDLPSSRLSELFNPEAKKPRALKLEEAVELSERYGVPLTSQAVSAGSLLPVLEVCLRYAPKEWTVPDVQRLAEEIELGLKLHQAIESSRQEPDHRLPASAGPDEQPPRKRG